MTEVEVENVYREIKMNEFVSEKIEDIELSIPPNLPAAVVASSPDTSGRSALDTILWELTNDLFTNQYGSACFAIKDEANYYALVVGSSRANNLIRENAQKFGIPLRNKEVFEFNEILKSRAEKSGKRMNTWNRVAPTQDGVEIDLGDEKLTRVLIKAGKVEIIITGSETLFMRSKLSKSMVMPAEVGDIKLLHKYLNMHPVSKLLLIGWLTYILAHPKISTSKYPILLLNGSEGTGKSFLCNHIILVLLDPSVVGLQMMPNNLKDLAIASQNSHVLAFDNIREIKPYMSDILCVASTGGAMTTRQLYSDSDMQLIHLHVALVLNGIYSFVSQPDLAQRCLPLQLTAINENMRKSEVEMVRGLQEDLPAILRGLFDLIANIFTHLPSAEVTNPERMIDFVKWLAAMEQVNGAPAGVYQAVYSDALNQCRLDALQDSLLASAVLDFAKNYLDEIWSGTPNSFLQELNKQATPSIQRSRDWPQNAIALSKRLIPLQASLLTQGITIEFSRGKNRTITINVTGDKK